MREETKTLRMRKEARRTLEAKVAWLQPIIPARSWAVALVSSSTACLPVMTSSGLFSFLITSLRLAGEEDGKNVESSEARRQVVGTVKDGAKDAQLGDGEGFEGRVRLDVDGLVGAWGSEEEAGRG